MQSDLLGDLGLIIGPEGHEWLVIIKGMSLMACLEKQGLISIKKLWVNTCPPMADSLLPLCGINYVNRPTRAYPAIAEGAQHARLVLP